MIDLLPEDYYEKNKLDKENIIQIALAIIAVIIIIIYGILYLRLVVETSRAEEKVSLASSEVDALREETRELSRLEERNQLLDDTLDRREEVEGDRLEWPAILLELSQLRPEHGWFVDFDFNQESGIELSAYTLKQEQLNDVVNSLRDSRYFKNIVLNSVRAERGLSEEVREEEKLIYYQLSADLVSTRKGADDYR